jgi:hypothetical protein
VQSASSGRDDHDHLPVRAAVTRPVAHIAGYLIAAGSVAAAGPIATVRNAMRPHCPIPGMLFLVASADHPQVLRDGLGPFCRGCGLRRSRIRTSTSSLRITRSRSMLRRTCCAIAAFLGRSGGRAELDLEFTRRCRTRRESQD